RIVARAYSTVQYRRWISRADIDEIEIGIVRAGDPHLSTRGTTARRLRHAWRRSAIESPLGLACLRIERLQLAGQIIKIAGDTEDHVITDDEWSIRGPIPFVGIGNHDIPPYRPVFGVECDEMRIRRRKINGIFVNGDAAMADVERIIFRGPVMPHLLACS